MVERSNLFMYYKPQKPEEGVCKRLIQIISKKWVIFRKKYDIYEIKKRLAYNKNAKKETNCGIVHFI